MVKTAMERRPLIGVHLPLRLVKRLEAVAKGNDRSVSRELESLLTEWDACIRSSATPRPRKEGDR